MLTVACVLKSGGEFLPTHVEALAAGVKRHLKQPYRFTCLTDIPSLVELLPGVRTETLIHEWPGWFSKLELFRPRLFEDPILYLDLDTIVVGSLDAIARGHYFTVLENFWARDRIGSGMMAWSVEAMPKLARIYEKFCRAPERYMAEYVVAPEKWGDQAFIHHHTPVEPARWQTKYPGKVVSFRRHVLKQQRVPPRAAVVCFAGKVRPWKLSEEQRAWFKEPEDVGEIHGSVRLATEA